MEKLAVHLSEVKFCLNVNYRKVEAKIFLTFQKVSGNSTILSFLVINVFVTFSTQDTGLSNTAGNSLSHTLKISK